MSQGILPFQYEIETGPSGLTAKAGLPLYLELAAVCGLRKSIERHVSARSGGQGWTDAQVAMSLVNRDLVAFAGAQGVEDTIRFVKQSHELENVRVLTYQRLKNLVTLLLAVTYFTAVRVGMEARMKILALHALDAAKRLFGIPAFRYYALADGIKDILLKAGKGTLYARDEVIESYPLLPLFDP